MSRFGLNTDMLFLLYYHLFQPGYFSLGQAPVVDGIFLPDMPSEIRRRGEHNKVPEIIGITQEDGSATVTIRKQKWQQKPSTCCVLFDQELVILLVLYSTEL